MSTRPKLDDVAAAGARWTPTRKALAVEFAAEGPKFREAVMARFDISPTEFKQWEEAYQLGGRRALSVRTPAQRSGVIFRSIAELAVLTHLWALGPRTTTDLSKALLIDQHTIEAICRSLHRGGMIDRPNPRRLRGAKVAFSLTAYGRQVLEEVPTLGDGRT